MHKVRRVFISHSSADNDRFVLSLATRLRASGIHAWLDFWEILPGDSLIDKIWNEGLKDCDAFIVVMSEASIRSNWVREELNAAVVKRIEDKTKLIPIRLDKCEVPQPLRGTLWIDIEDPASFEREFERLFNAICGLYDKPPIGNPPDYVTVERIQIHGLAPIDATVLSTACKLAIQRGNSHVLSGQQLASELRAHGISELEVMDAIDVLEGRAFLKVHRVLGPPHVYDFSVTWYGFDQFARSGAISDYEAIFSDVVCCLVQDPAQDNEQVCRKLDQPIRVIEHVFESLEGSGLIKCGNSIGGDLSGIVMDVFWISPELKRRVA